MFSTLFAFTFPVYVYAFGLGEMSVKSALGQPFAAEVKLIDVHEISLSNVRAGLADPQSYQSLGIEWPETANSLFLEIKKNKQGKYSVVIYSTEQITEPYMQLIIDLTWSKGQIYKVYTVLLDPPGYKLASTTAQSGLTYQRQFSNYHQKTVVSTKVSHNTKKGVYGPTIANENIWQIAQRYKTSDAILPQIVLAIVGANPDAFTQGNLNGLKVGVRLKIPSAPGFVEVPADLATVEVMAHDKAWNEKTSINHVLSPPYMIGQTPSISPPIEYSQIPPVPKFSGSTLPVMNQTQSETTSVNLLSSIESQKQISPEQRRTLNAEISITAAAVDSLRESNALLTEQLSLLQAQNKKLQKQLDERDKQIQILMRERIAIAGQTSSSSLGTFSNAGFLISLLLIAGSGGITYYYFKRRDQRKSNLSKVTNPVESAPASTPAPVPTPTPIESFIHSKEQPVAQQEISELRSEPKLKPDLELIPKPQVAEQLVLPSAEVENLKTVANAQDNVSTSTEPRSQSQPKPEDNERLLEFSSDVVEDKLIKPSHENQNLSSEELPEENLLEFESGLHHTIAKESIQEANYPKEIASEDKGLEFTFTPSDSEKTTPEKTTKNDIDLSNLKNEKALDTLLALAKTYIGMEDIESALNSLDEVLQHGSKVQKEEAKRLLAEIKGQS